MKYIQKVMVTIILILTMAPAFSDMQAVGLMQGMAILEVDGQRVVIRNGQTKQGVTLIMADSTEAIVKYKGKQVALSLGLSVASSYVVPETENVRLYRAGNGHYFANVKINGQAVNTMVDTGATTVAMSSEVAKKLGINYASGKKGQSSTAGGIVNSYSLRSDHIQVGGIKKYGVPISVIEGSFPEITLLGMSFLNRLSMNEDSGVLTLSDK